MSKRHGTVGKGQRSLRCCLARAAGADPRSLRCPGTGGRGRAPPGQVQRPWGRSVAVTSEIPLASFGGRWVARSRENLPGLCVRAKMYAGACGGEEVRGVRGLRRLGKNRPLSFW